HLDVAGLSKNRCRNGFTMTIHRHGEAWVHRSRSHGLNPMLQGVKPRDRVVGERKPLGQLLQNLLAWLCKKPKLRECVLAFAVSFRRELSRRGESFRRRRGETSREHVIGEKRWVRCNAHVDVRLLRGLGNAWETPISQP